MKNLKFTSFKTFNPYIVPLLLLVFFSCKKDPEPTLSEPPTEADAVFTYAPSAQNANIIEFAASNSSLSCVWNFGNGTTGNGPSVSATYPNAGTYTVSLTVFNQGGSASSSQQIVIDQTDPSLLDDPLYVFLTGGSNGPGSKTWVVDSASQAHFGVGPTPSHPDFDGFYAKWWAAGPNEKPGCGFYDDRYTFYLTNFQYDMVTNGNVYVNNQHAGDFPGGFTNLGDFTCPLTDQLNETWSITKAADTMLSVSGTSFIGVWTGTRDYKVLNISDTSLWLQYYDTADPDLSWYLRLIPEGFVSSGSGGGGGNPTPTYSLPLDFESVEPVFTTFGNSTSAVINNPDPSGINTSSKVLETVHGNETWSGLYVSLDSPLDFSTQPSINLKVWAPITGDFRIKVENSANSNDFVEVDVTVQVANSWQEISADFSSAVSGVFDRLVLFPGWNIPNSGTFYIDDIQQQ